MNTPRNFAMQLGSLITLYISVTALITLLFGVITVSFPDDADYYYAFESATNSIRFSIALLIVFFPVYLGLTRSVNTIRRREEGVYLTLTKWLVYLSLLIGGGVLLGDLVAVINSFLNGELTVRFALKAAVLAIVIAAAFYYYLMDAKNYWQTHERQSLQFALGATVLVLVALVLGFMNSETPAEVREMRIDNNQIADLQEIQWQVEEYYRIENALPSSLPELYGDIPAPQAPEGRAAYELNVTGEDTYELCAEFAADSNRNEFSRVSPFTEKNYNWTHGTGEWCFERVAPADPVR